jgi:serine/threonine-protein kinase
MERARWERVQALFHAAAELAPESRAQHVRNACDGDAGLADEVLALFAEEVRAASLLEADVAGLAGALLDRAQVPAGRPDAFGPYRIVSLLGEGGMGVVYLAERADLGTRAALKVLRDAWLSPARRERFVAEQRTLAQLVHPAIATLFDAGSLADGTPWIAMEHVAGVPLTEYCRAHDTSVEGRLELFRGVCEAVQHAHGQAVIHRDLKPSNVLVKADGTVKLLDFGIAKHLADLEPAREQTVTVMRLLTPAYAAPEQISGARADIRSDVYSLGVILYELLAQRLPFDAAERLGPPGLAADPVRPSQVAPARIRARSGKAAWADLDVLCFTAMHVDPARRYPTVEALIRDVDRYLANEPLAARPDSLAYRAAKFVRRNRRAVVGASAALLALVALGAFYTVRLAAARDEARDEAARSVRVQRFMKSLFDGGDEAAGPTDELRVLDLLERGVHEAGALEGEPAVQAELYRTLGGLYQGLGDGERADELFTLALERQRAVAESAGGPRGASNAETANTLVMLGLLRVDQARHAEAERLVREGLVLLRRSVPAGHPAIAEATAALGQVLEAAGDYDGAILVDEEAVRLSARGGEDSVEHVAALGQLADSHFYAGHYEVADDLNERVLAATVRIYGERHPRVADVLINLGASRFDRGYYAEAEPYYRRALGILTAFHGPEHHRVASAQTMLGRALVYQKRFDEGVPLLGAALLIQERVFGPLHPRVASALNDLGVAALRQDRLDEAEAHFRRMLAIYRAVHPDGHYLVGTATSNVASVLAARGDHPSAEALFRDAIAIFAETLSPEHLNTGIGRIKLGRELLRQRRFAEAKVESLAGYRIVAAEASPSVSWLRSAREDLVLAYEALERPDDAASFRADGAP